MTIDRFEEAVKFVLEKEGVYSNDKDDKGGETKYGISKRWYPDFDGTLEGAKAIYKEHYWNALDCDHREPDLAIVLFDTAVNCGVGRAVKWLSSDKTVEGMLALRVRHYLDICARDVTQYKWLRGWLRRVTGVWDFARRYKGMVEGRGYM